MLIHVVSISGGKDSTATALLARELESPENIRRVFADTGNEHELTYEYLQYLEDNIGPITRLRADFSNSWWQRREYVRDVYPVKLVEKDGYSAVEADEIVKRCLEVLDRGPTGNPYLDLCIIKGRFPSRRAQFCTAELKITPIVEYQLGLIHSGICAVWSWQGIRAEEGGRRRYAPEFELVGDGIYIYRPILRWTASDCFQAMATCGIKPNPLYRLGMRRVGCMPCINASKAEVLEISKRFPEHIDRIEQWEFVVSGASKRGLSSFFAAPADGRAEQRGSDIRAYVRWSRTSRGWRTEDMFADEPPKACASAYGLCE